MAHSSKLMPTHIGNPLRAPGWDVSPRGRTKEATCHRGISVLPSMLTFTRWRSPSTRTDWGKVWRELGLELRPELNVLQSKRTPSTTSIYYIHHTHQHSGLFVPQDVPCGYLSEFFCSFQYASRTSRTPRTPGNAGKPVPRSRSHTHYNLRKLAGTPSEPDPVCAVAFWGLPLDVQAERVVHLTQNALNQMLGMRRRCLGVRCVHRTKPPALLELAPALWNAQYFQVSKSDSSYSQELMGDFRILLLGHG